MAIVRREDRGVTRNSTWDAFDEMARLMGGWDPFRQMMPLAAEERGFVPRFDVKETKDGYVFKADLPGVKESDLDISLAGNLLTVSGRREAEKHDEGDTWFSYERSYGTFSRSFTLPEAADADHVHAEMRDGVLSLVLPKRPELQPRKIAVGKTAADPAKAKA